MSSIGEKLGLTPFQTRLLFSCQYHLTQKDLQQAFTVEDKQLKRKWVSEWKNSIDIFLKSKKEKGIITISRDLDKELRKLSRTLKLKIPFYLIVLECTVFRPYFPLAQNPEKCWKSLKYYYKNQSVEDQLISFANAMNVD